MVVLSNNDMMDSLARYFYSQTHHKGLLPVEAKDGGGFSDLWVGLVPFTECIQVDR